MDYGKAVYASQLIYDRWGKKVNPDLLWAQMRHETGNFESPLSAYHNYGGIKTYEDTGLLVPEEERKEGDPWYYKSYDSDEEYVQDWVKTVGAYMADADIDEIDTPEQFVYWLTQGESKYFTDDPASYAKDMYGLMGDIGDIAAPRQNMWRTNSNIWQNPERPEQKEYTFWDEFSTKFANAALDSGGASFIRTVWANMNPFEWAKGNAPWSDYTPDEEDMKLVRDAFFEDRKTRDWILENATNKTALRELIEMQQRNKRLQKEADEMPMGLSTIGTVLGSLADPVTLIAMGVNPLIGVGAKAASLSAKATAALVKARIAASAVSGFIDKSKMMRYGMYAMRGAGAVGADRWGAATFGNYEPDYAMNMTLGATLGAVGLRLSRWGVDKNKIPEVARAMDGMENNVAANAMGAVPPIDVVANEKAFLKSINVATTSPLIRKGSVASRLVDNGSLYMTSMENAVKVAKRYGIELDRTAKAFTIPKAGVSVLIAEKVTKKNIDGLIAHEVGVHLALRDQMKPEAYDALMEAVVKQAQTSKDVKWRRAAKMGDSPEEILAYWMEQNPKASDPLMQDIVKAVKEGNVTDSTIKNEVQKALYGFSNKKIIDMVKQNVTEHNTPVYKMADGSHVVDGIKYSKGNMFSTIFDDWDDHGAGSKLRQQQLPKYIPGKRWMETSRLYGNIYGLMANSRSPKLQKAAQYLLHDARMGNKTTDYMPAEQIKQTVLDQIQRLYNDFYDARTDYINNTFGIIRGRLNRNNYINAVNEQVIKCIDAMALDKDLSVYPPEIQNLAKQMLKVNAELIKWGKQDSEHLGGVVGKGSLIDKDWEPLTNAFYRVTDPDKLLEQMTKWETPEKFQAMLEEYAKHFVDREKLMKHIEDTRKKEIEQKQKAWDEKHKNDGEPVREEVTPFEKSELEKRRQAMEEEVKAYRDKETEEFNAKHEKWEDIVTTPKPEPIVPNEKVLKTLMSDTEWEGYVKKHKRDYDKKKAKYDALRNRPKPVWSEPRRVPKEYKEHPEEYVKMKKEQYDKQVALWEKRKRNPYPKYEAPKRPTVGGYDSPAKYKKAIEKKNREALAKWEKAQKTPEPVLKRKSTGHLKSVQEFNKYAKEHVGQKDHDFEVQQRAYERVQESRPEYKPLSEEEMEKQISQYCKDWAYGMSDRGASTLKFGAKYDPLRIDHFKFRLPMDTSKELKLKNGMTFCFDRDLRDFAMDEYVPQIFNRMTGEIGLHAVLGNKKAQKAFFDSVEQELGHTDMILNHTREREAMEYALDKILGRKIYNQREITVGDNYWNMLRTWSYATKGAMMTLAQLGEFGGAIAYGGMKMLLNTIPKLGDTIRTARVGKDAAETIQNVNLAIYADDVQTKAWKTTASTNSRVFRHQMDKSKADFAKPTRTSELLDMTNRGIKRAALMTSFINMMPELTNRMIQAMRSSAIEDCYKWANGKDFGKIRNPFSDKKMAAVGIHGAKEIADFRAKVKKYLVDGKGDVDKWWDEDPASYFKWKQLMDNQAYRGIQQSTVGNTNTFKEQHRIIFQFKDFALRAVNGQLMRALQSHELDDGLAVAFSMCTNASTYAALTWAKGYMMYPNDEQKRQKYFDDRLSWGMIAAAGFTRASFMTPLSFAMDGVEAMTGQSFFRTTVDNSGRSGRGNVFDANSGWEVGKNMGQQMIQQMPPLTAIADTSATALNAGRLMTGNGDQKDVENFVRGLPMGTWLPLIYMGSLLKEKSGLPKDDKKPEKKDAWSNMTSKRKPVKKPGKLSKLIGNNNGGN